MFTLSKSFSDCSSYSEMQKYIRWLQRWRGWICSRAQLPPCFTANCSASDSKVDTGKMDTSMNHASFMFSVLRFMYVEHSSEQVSYSPLQLNDFATRCFLLNNGAISVVSSNRGDGRKNTTGRKAVLGMPLDSSKISSTSCESRSVVIYLDTDRAFCISQDEGVAVYLPFLNSALDIPLLNTHLLQPSVWQRRINQLPAPSSRAPSHRSSTMRSDRSLSGVVRFLHTGLDIQVML